MGHIIAVSGKGGVGKTTLCGLLIQVSLRERQEAGAGRGRRCECESQRSAGEWKQGGDAGRAPGVRSSGPASIRSIRFRRGITKPPIWRAVLADALTEEDDYDLMVMGAVPRVRDATAS